MDAQQDKNAALAQVAENAGPEFYQAVVDLLQNFNGSLVTGEDIRIHCEARQIKPHHHNAWGAAISKLVKRGLIEETGDYRPMRGRKSHGRKTQVYRVTMPELSHFQWMLSQLKIAKSKDRLLFLSTAIRQDSENGLIPPDKLGELRQAYAYRVQELKN